MNKRILPRDAFPLVALVLALMPLGCNAADEQTTTTPDAGPGPEQEPEIAEGIFSRLGDPLPSATKAELATFARGLEVANRRFSIDEGLGPNFNVSFCGGCHEKPVPGGSAGRYRNFLLTGARLADDSFVPTGTNGVGVQFSFNDPARVPTDEDTNNVATRNPIPFFGVGLLAEIEDKELLKLADPDDEDEDGISGRPNYDRGFVGRFGRKSQTVSIEGFIRGPLFNHLGLTSNPLPNDRANELPVPSGVMDVSARIDGEFSQLAQAQAAAPGEPNFDDDGVPDPELSEDDLFDVVAFSMLLGVPEPEPLQGIAKQGANLFEEIGCTDCHVQTLKGPRGLLPLYSDLLVHDMGDDLADGVKMLGATGREFRTQPLWGVVAVAPYLHDGRADTLEEAIEWHGGEAKRARDEYLSLTGDEQAAVVEFLRSLGGRDQLSAGLLPPDAPVPATGTPGGPETELSSAETKRFISGREVFDSDFALAAGLGPNFNGDSCRACHFEPTIGGAGPVGVNVMRQGLVEDDVFVMPKGGTMAHRLTTAVNERAAIDEDAAFFEQRQTPSLLGLGLIEAIADASIIALEDPDDEDGDGISGRAHRLADGRLGRLGWKANVPSLAEFARDALSVEMGVTLPDQAGLTFGIDHDDDDAADPEVSKETIEDLVFFMAQLAAPRRGESGAAERRGEALFDDVGCALCHTPQLATTSGSAVALYSDLLLHDVAPEGYIGIGEGDATPQEFRTPPLWGIGQTGPYLHDGRAATLADAIVAHEGEAKASVNAYQALSKDEKSDLERFLLSL